MSVGVGEELVAVEYWSHPDWVGELIVEATPKEINNAIEFLGEDYEPELIQKRASTMTRFELENLPEFDGI